MKHFKMHTNILVQPKRLTHPILSNYGEKTDSRLPGIAQISIKSVTAWNGKEIWENEEIWEIWDTGVWVVGALAGGCSEAQTERSGPSAQECYLALLKQGGYRMCLIQMHQREVRGQESALQLDQLHLNPSILSFFFSCIHHPSIHPSLIYPSSNQSLKPGTLSLGGGETCRNH